jgi:glycosyltransferase involved in cell wall biosynthesis
MTAGNSQSVLLYDDGDWSEGHYEGIFGLYAKALLENGYTVSAACPRPGLIRRQLGELAEKCSFHQTNGRELKAKHRQLKPLTRLMWWMRAGQTVRRIQRADGHRGPVFFMNINHLRGALWSDSLSDRLMPCPWSAFTYDSSCVRGKQADLKKQFHFLSAGKCTGFGVTDEKMVEPMQAAFPKIRIQFLPDATPEETGEPPAFAREIRGLSRGRKTAGLLGMLHKRKGLLDALKLAETRPDIFFVFAGACDLSKMTPDEKAFATSFIERRPENCFFHLKRIETEAEFNALVQQLDIVLAVYPGFSNSSGLLTKAGLFGKPCLVAEGDTCMADRVKKYRMGAAVPAGDIQAMSDAINTLASEDSTAFRNDFSGAALSAALKKLISG